MENLQRKAALKILQKDKNVWEALLSIRTELLNEWSDEPLKRENEFETTWHTAQIEGKKDGITAFFNRIEQVSLND